MWDKYGAMNVLRACALRHTITEEERRNDYDFPLYGMAVAYYIMGAVHFVNRGNWAFDWEGKSCVNSGAQLELGLPRLLRGELRL